MADLEWLLARARRQKRPGPLFVTVTTIQDGGVASYSYGALEYVPARAVGGHWLPERLMTRLQTPLKWFVTEPASAALEVEEAFSPERCERIGLSLSSLGGGRAIGRFTLPSWGDVGYDVPLRNRPGVLIGVGPGFGGEISTACYAVALGADFEESNHAPG